MWLLKTIIVLILRFRIHTCIEVITSERNVIPKADAHFVIPGLNLSSLGTFTMCGRFNIYQFQVQGEYNDAEWNDLSQGINTGFGTYSLVHCDDWFCPRIAEADSKGSL